MYYFLRRQLSNGHFSADNQKRLKGSSMEVPIFEAKLTGDLRLVVSFSMKDFKSWHDLIATFTVSSRLRC